MKTALPAKTADSAPVRDRPRVSLVREISSCKWRTNRFCRLNETSIRDRDWKGKYLHRLVETSDSESSIYYFTMISTFILCSLHCPFARHQMPIRCATERVWHPSIQQESLSGELFPGCQLSGT